MLKVTSCGRKCTANKQDHGSAHDRRHIMTSPGYTGPAGTCKQVLPRLPCYYSIGRIQTVPQRLWRQISGLGDPHVLNFNMCIIIKSLLWTTVSFMMLYCHYIDFLVYVTHQRFHWWSEILHQLGDNLIDLSTIQIYTATKNNSLT